jgi:hypothetical protein
MNKRTVMMPEQVYLAEHKRLIKLLQSGNKPMKKEAKSQQKEIASYLKKRRL